MRYISAIVHSTHVYTAEPQDPALRRVLWFNKGDKKGHAIDLNVFINWASEGIACSWWYETWTLHCHGYGTDVRRICGLANLHYRTCLNMITRLARPAAEPRPRLLGGAGGGQHGLGRGAAAAAMGRGRGRMVPQPGWHGQQVALNAYHRFYNRTISQVFVSFVMLLASRGRSVFIFFVDIHCCFPEKYHR